MFEPFFSYIEHKTGGFPALTAADREQITRYFQVKTVRKRQYLLQEGEQATHHYFVIRGCLRLFRVDEKGQDHIIQFAIENWWISDRESLISGKPSKYMIEALEDTEVLKITSADLDTVSNTVAALKQAMQKVQQNNVVATQNRIHAAISFTAEQKYLHFLDTYPDIFQRVPQQMIASYLGITRETLSRIRRQAVRGK